MHAANNDVLCRAQLCCVCCVKLIKNVVPAFVAHQSERFQRGQACVLVAACVAKHACWRWLDGDVLIGLD